MEFGFVARRPSGIPGRRPKPMPGSLLACAEVDPPAPMAVVAGETGGAGAGTPTGMLTAFGNCAGGVGRDAVRREAELASCRGLSGMYRTETTFSGSGLAKISDS